MSRNRWTLNSTAMSGSNDDAKKYIDEWTRVQIQIWKEKIERMNIVRSGALHESFKDAITHTADGSTISMKFYSYGIYQALGVGNGYRHGNGGDLPFLGKEYRQQHGLDKKKKVGPAWGGYMTSGKPRKKRDWYSKKLYMSTMAMLEDMVRIMGEEAASVICDQLTDTRSAL